MDILKTIMKYKADEFFKMAQPEYERLGRIGALVHFEEAYEDVVPPETGEDEAAIYLKGRIIYLIEANISVIPGDEYLKKAHDMMAEFFAEQLPIIQFLGKERVGQIIEKQMSILLAGKQDEIGEVVANRLNKVIKKMIEYRLSKL